MYKLLFFIPSPRNIPEVKEPIVKLLYKKHDVIWMKYYREIDAYTKARQFFLNSAENYDYLVILPDDLVINEEGLDNILEELENPSINTKQYDVLSGICNLSFVNRQQAECIAAMGATIPTKDNMTSIDIWDHMIKYKDLDMRPENIIECKFIGFSLYFIHKNVVKNIPFRNDNADQPNEGIDSFFCQDLHSYGYKQYIDKRSSFVHLKGLSAQSTSSISTNPDILLVGKIKPHTILVKREKILEAIDKQKVVIESEVYNTAGTDEEKKEIQTQEEELTGKTTSDAEKLDKIKWKPGGRNKPRKRKTV